MRELENLIKRMVVLGTDESIRRELAEAIAGRTSDVGSDSGAAGDGRRGAGDQQPAAAAPSRRPRSPSIRLPPAPLGSLKDIARQAAREAERELIFRTLQQTRWNRREAAEILGISYKALLYKIKEAELDKAS